MLMLPPELLKPIADAMQVALSPSASRAAPGLLALLNALIRGYRKSPEELLLEAVEAGIERSDKREAATARLREIARDPNMEHQRVLAHEAARLVTPDNFIMPALPIAGRIFRDSEFEEPGTPIWDMWAQLLARACDKDRVDQAHPSFPWIISQLSGDEAKILAALAVIHPRTSPPHMLEAEVIPSVNTSEIGVVFPSNVPFYVSHIASLGLLVLPMGWEPTAHRVMIDAIITYMLTDFGRTFMAAVTPPIDGD